MSKKEIDSLRPDYLCALAACLSAPSDDGHHVSITDAEVCALALRSLAGTLDQIAALPADTRAVLAHNSRDLDAVEATKPTL